MNPSASSEVRMSTETLLIILVVLFLLGGGGWGYLVGAGRVARVILRPGPPAL
jgi:hypothetical protein